MNICLNLFYLLLLLIKKNGILTTVILERDLYGLKRRLEQDDNSNVYRRYL